MKLPEKLRGLTPYTPQTGEFPHRMNANENAFPLSETLSEKLAALLADTELNRYPDAEARALRSAFADAFGVPFASTLAGNGSDELIYLILNAFLEEGDRVLLCTPDFEMYGFYARSCKANILTLSKTENGEIEPDKLLRECIEKQPTLVLFSNPCNPTGLALSRAQVLSLVRGAPECTFVVDEAYMDFYDENESVLRDAPDFENLIVLRTLSKSFALAAARLGFAVSNPSLAEALGAFKSPYNVNTLSQIAGTFLLQEGREEHAKSLNKIQLLREEMYARLAALQDRFGFSLLPSCANFFLLRFPSDRAAKLLFEALKQNGILVRAFDKALRVTVSTPEDNEAFLSVLSAVQTKEMP